MHLQISTSLCIICAAGSTAERSTQERDVQAVGLRGRVWMHQETAWAGDIASQSSKVHLNIKPSSGGWRSLPHVSVLQRTLRLLVGMGATRSFLSSFSDCWSDQRLFKSFLLNSCFAAHACTGAAPPRPPLCCQPEGAELGRTRPSGSPLFLFIYMIFFKALVDPRSAYLTGWT